VHNCGAPFTSHRKLPEFGAKKPAHFHFFAINFTVWSHILSTVGDAITQLPNACNKSYWEGEVGDERGGGAVAKTKTHHYQPP